MGRFLDAAYQVLLEQEAPMTHREITSQALDKGFLISQGKTPWQTMKSKLSIDILTKKEKSVFMRTETGKFALRRWKEMNVDEYIADRYKKALLEEDVIVFPASSIWKYISGSGLHTFTLINSKQLLDECYPMLRRDAEENEEVIQLVSVFILKYRTSYLTYKRTKRLPESRLHGYRSLIFGGHITPRDNLPLFDIFYPEHGAKILVRELNEEVIFPKSQPPAIKYKGILYDTSRKVSSQHLGIVYDVYMSSQDYEIGEKGFLMDPKLETLEEIDARIHDFENWSILVAEYEKADQKW